MMKLVAFEVAGDVGIVKKSEDAREIIRKWALSYRYISLLGRNLHVHS
jgi:uncharacterized protein (UPF0297 family)